MEAFETALSERGAGPTLSKLRFLEDTFPDYFANQSDNPYQKLGKFILNTNIDIDSGKYTSAPNSGDSELRKFSFQEIRTSGATPHQILLLWADLFPQDRDVAARAFEHFIEEDDLPETKIPVVADQ